MPAFAITIFFKMIQSWKFKRWRDSLILKGSVGKSQKKKDAAEAKNFPAEMGALLILLFLRVGGQEKSEEEIKIWFWGTFFSLFGLHIC